MDGQNFNNGFEQQPAQGQNGYQQPVYQQPMPEQPMYQQPMQQPYYAEPAQQPNNSKGMAIASLVLGIIGTVACCVPIVAVICGIVGLILGIVANKKNKTGMGTAGIVLSIIALVFGIGMWAYSYYVLTTAEGAMNSMMNELMNQYY